MQRIDIRDPLVWEQLDTAERGTSWLLRHPDRLDEIGQSRLLDRLRPDDRYIAIADDPAAIAPALARRIAAVEIAAPALAERREDVPLLARHFARIAAERHGLHTPRFTPPPKRCWRPPTGPTRHAASLPRSNARCCSANRA